MAQFSTIIYCCCLFSVTLRSVLSKSKWKGSKWKLPRQSFLMPSIIWDPRNSIFNCPGKGINTVNVRMTDYLIFACQGQGRNIEWHHQVTLSYVNMYENGWFLRNETAALNCDASAETAPPLFNCNDPWKLISHTIRMSKYSEAPGDPRIRPNTTYYLIGTGTGTRSGLGQKVGGRCVGYNDGTERTYNMTLRIRVCPREEAGKPSCPICMDTACYNNGCGVFSEWKKTEKFQYEKNKCYEVWERTCDDFGGSCEGPSQKVIPTNLTNCYDLQKITGWDKVGSPFKENNTCFQTYKSVCNSSKILCDHKETQMEVAHWNCKDNNPNTAKRTGEQNGSISIMVGVFVMCMLGPALMCLIFGFVIGWWMTKRKGKTDIISEQREQLRMARQNSC
eukprot:Seg1931.3 transcript_id=Seg1931.3/GoldUCD/mRNA.D3Y31 product="hypothetical protein" protein_id=Seg1931.3/GoldUCD/D3Y31